MKYNNQISFPYPCLREITDDFIKGKFSVTYEPTIPPKQNIVKFKVVYKVYDFENQPCIILRLCMILYDFAMTLYAPLRYCMSE